MDGFISSILCYAPCPLLFIRYHYFNLFIGLCDRLLSADQTSAAIVKGQKLNNVTLVAAIAALRADVAAAGASTDPRWSGAYKLNLATGFLYKVTHGLCACALFPLRVHQFSIVVHCLFHLTCVHAIVGAGMVWSDRDVSSWCCYVNVFGSVRG